MASKHRTKAERLAYIDGQIEANTVARMKCLGISKRSSSPSVREEMAALEKELFEYEQRLYTEHDKTKEGC